MRAATFIILGIIAVTAILTGVIRYIWNEKNNMTALPEAYAENYNYDGSEITPEGIEVKRDIQIISRDVSNPSINITY